MATDTAVAPPTSAPTDPTRNVWQLPALLLGIAAFVCVWRGYVPLDTPEQQLNIISETTKLKFAYEKTSPDIAELRRLLAKVAESVESDPEQASQTHFHLGSGYSRLAEITAAADEARGYWMLAIQHFELVDAKQLRDATDGQRLAFRTAKARVAVGLPDKTPREEVTKLLAAISVQQTGEDAGETQRLIAELAMRLDPPDTARAKVALKQYLTDTGGATPSESLSRARLSLGLLYIQSGQPGDYEQARKWLSDIDNNAPPEVLAPAKRELARVLMYESDWKEAAKQLEQLRNLPGMQSSDRLSAAYPLGLCRLKLNDTPAAMRLFEEAAKGEKREETQAAAIQLAELYLRDSQRKLHKSAVELLEKAFKDVKRPADYNEIYLKINVAQAVFELAIATLLTDGDYEMALRAVAKYKAIASADRDRDRRAAVVEAWAESLQKNPEEAKPKYQDAANEFAALAGLQPTPEAKVELLRHSATLSRKANDHNTAIERLKEALKQNPIRDELLQTVSLELVEAYLAIGKPEEVPRLVNGILVNGNALSTATLYRLARAFMDSRHPECMQSGLAFFEQIAKKQNVVPDEREYHERALIELADADIRKGNFADAEAKLRTQLGLYQNGPEAPQARLMLGWCLLQRSVSPKLQSAEVAKLHTEALACFKRIVSDCDATERAKGKLTKHEASLRLQASLRMLQTYRQMGKTTDLLADAKLLLDRYKDTVEELIIRSWMFHAYKQLNDQPHMLEQHAIMKETFQKLPASVFTQPTGDYSREYWRKEWFPDLK